MKKLGNTEAELKKKRVAYKKVYFVIFQNLRRINESAV